MTVARLQVAIVRVFSVGDGTMRKAAMVLLVQALLVAGFAAAVRSGALPLGVRGEWEWQRLPRGIAVSPLSFVVGLTGVAVYAVAAAIVLRGLGPEPSWRRELGAVGGLLLASVVVQLVVTTAAPEGYGLTKWAMALHNPGSSGYYTVARRQIRDPWRFLRDYPDWIRHQDALHVGTHPPGLFLVAQGLRKGMESRPATARWLVDHLPRSVDQGFQIIAQYDPLPRADRAALTLMGALTLLACAATVVPLYVLARAALPAQAAWGAAVLWPLVPSAILFQPAADAAFPLLSTSALALTAQATRLPGRRSLAACVAAGTILALGMGFTLAFLPVGLIAGLVLATEPGRSARQRSTAIAATGAGFIGALLLAWMVTRSNPFVIWWWNQRNHARFYLEYRRTYLSWLVANPIELAVALGIPSAVGLVLGLAPPRAAPRVTVATLLVLALLTLSGKNLSEVARLWLLLMPPLLVSAGRALTRFDGGPWLLGGTVFLTGLQTLILEATIQVVYPV